MKTEETTRLENLLWKHTDQRKDFGCFEVTVGWYGKQRVDFMTIDSKNTVRCYEIKVTKSDFHSKHGHNFVGAFNYYVMPQALYEEVKDEIPANIGVYTDKFKNDIYCVKKSKRRDCNNVEDLKLYMIRSLQREVDKSFRAKDVEYINELKRIISRKEADRKRSKKDYDELFRSVMDVYGIEGFSKLRKARMEWK